MMVETGGKPKVLVRLVTWEVVEEDFTGVGINLDDDVSSLIHLVG